MSHYRQVYITRGGQGLEKLPDDVRDSLLLANGINAITNVAQILLDPHDIPGVKQHLSGALGALGAFVQALIRSPRHRGKLQDYIEEMTDDEVKVVVDHLLKIFHMNK